MRRFKTQFPINQKSQNMSDKFSLKWNDYQSNWGKSLNELREDTEFADVILMSDDKVNFSAHKILLLSCSNLIKFILKSNSQTNPLLYLGGVDSINLKFILDYIYYGEVNLYQEQLDSFLEIAQKLEIQGLMGDKESSQGNFIEGQSGHQQPEEDFGQVINNAHVLGEEKSVVKMENGGTQMRRQYSRSSSIDVTKFDVGSMTSEEIDKKMRELYEKTDEGWRCLACGHTNSGSRSSNIRMHVETHLDGLSYNCNICNKEFRSRKALDNHKSSSIHKNNISGPHHL